MRKKHFNKFILSTSIAYFLIISSISCNYTTTSPEKLESKEVFSKNLNESDSIRNARLYWIIERLQKLGSVIANIHPSQSMKPFQEKIGQSDNEELIKYGSKQKDPYNQNQLLNALPSTNVGGSHNLVSSESFPLSSGIIVNSGSDSSGGLIGNGITSSSTNSVNNIINMLLGDDTSSSSSIISNLLSLGTGSMQKILLRIHKFDKLQCIPKMLCSTIAQRQLASLLSSNYLSSSTQSNKLRLGKTIKFEGVETALEQFIVFLDVVNLKNWPLYPYIKAAYAGGQVKSSNECLEKFRTCPFSDQQLVYYFNNYNGGIFHSLRSD